MHINILPTLIRTLIALGLAAIVIGQMGTNPTALLVIAFLATVVWSRRTREGVA